MLSGGEGGAVWSLRSLDFLQWGCSVAIAFTLVFIAVFQILVIDQGIKTDKGFILVELIFGLEGANKQL